MPPPYSSRRRLQHDDSIVSSALHWIKSEQLMVNEGCGVAGAAGADCVAASLAIPPPPCRGRDALPPQTPLQPVAQPLSPLLQHPPATAILADTNRPQPLR